LRLKIGGRDKGRLIPALLLDPELTHFKSYFEKNFSMHGWRRHGTHSSFDHVADALFFTGK